MSRLFKLLYDVAGIRTRYLSVHDELFSVSASKLLRMFRHIPARDSAAQLEVLEKLSRELAATREDLATLNNTETSMRRGAEIRRGLEDYVVALAETVEILRQVVRAKDVAAAQRDPNEQRLRGLKVAYDDAMQYHKRLGSALNKLISDH